MIGFFYNKTFKKAIMTLLLIAMVISCMGFFNMATTYAADPVITFPQDYHAVKFYMYNLASGTGTGSLGNEITNGQIGVPSGTNYVFAVKLDSRIIQDTFDLSFQYSNDTTRYPLNHNTTYSNPSNGLYVYSIPMTSSITLFPKAYCRITFTGQLPSGGAFVLQEGQTNYTYAKIPYGESYTFILTRTDINEGKTGVPHQVPVLSRTDLYGTILPTLLGFQKNTPTGTQVTYTYKYDSVTTNITINADMKPMYFIYLPASTFAPPRYTTSPASGYHMINEVAAGDNRFSFDLTVDSLYVAATAPAITVSDQGTSSNVKLSGNGMWRYTIGGPPATTGGPPTNIDQDYAVTISEQWPITQYSVTVVTLLPAKYTVTPEHGFVDYNGTFTFVIKPTTQYIGNPAPRVYSANTTFLVTNLSDGSFKVDVPNVVANTQVYIDTSNWVPDPNDPGNYCRVTMVLGNGISVGSTVFTGSALGNSEYNVMKGTDFNFSLNLDSQYDRNTLVVKVGSSTIFADNSGIYRLTGVTAPLTITATASLKTTTTSPTISGSSSPSSSAGQVDDGTLKFWEVTDNKWNIMVSGFFVGKPEIVITELTQNDPAYMKMLAAGDADLDTVLRAVDIHIKNGVPYGVITVGIGVGVGYNTIQMLVLHATPGSTERILTYGQNGMANVSVTSTSPFMVVDIYGMGPGYDGPNGDSGSGGGSGSGSGGNVTINPPRTGGAENVFGFILLGAVAVSICFIIWYRKKA